MKPLIGIAFAAMILGACGGDEVKDGSVTPEEAAALDDAAEMLDAPIERPMTEMDEVAVNGDMPVEEGADTGDLPVTDLGGVEER